MITDEKKKVVADLQPDFEKIELDQLKAALKRTYTERFLMATTLYKVQMTLNKAKITRTPYILPEK